jgi:hypothetical protein
MPSYRLFFFKKDHIVDATNFTATDDAVAIRMAEGIRGSLAAELWLAARKVEAFGEVTQATD